MLLQAAAKVRRCRENFALLSNLCLPLFRGPGNRNKTDPLTTMNSLCNDHDAAGDIVTNASTARNNFEATGAATTLRRQESSGDTRIPPGSPPPQGAVKASPPQSFYNTATRTLHHVNFFCLAPKAGQVSLAGDFNNWDVTATPMIRRPDGNWSAGLELPHGHHQYVFWVDGKPVLDPKAAGRVRNDRNELVSLIAVS